MPELLTEDPFVFHLITKWNSNKELVEGLDEQLDAENLSKTKVLNSAVNTAEGYNESQPVVTAVQEILARLKENDEVFVGVITALRRSLKPHDAVVAAYVAKNVVDIPDDQKISTDEEIKLRGDRKIAVDSNNAIRSLLEQQNPEWFALQGEGLLPKLENKKGAVGGTKTGKRLVGTFQWQVEDTIIQQHQMGAVAKFLGTSVGDLRDSIKSQIADLDWENPPAEFVFNFNKKVVKAHRVDDDTPNEDADISTEVEPEDDEDALFNEE